MSNENRERPAERPRGEIPKKISAQVEDYRRRIDKLDEEIVRLLNARATCALEIGHLKDSVGMAINQPAREVDVYEHVQQINDGPLDRDSIRRLFERIIDANRRLERLAKGDEDQPARD